MPGTANSGGRNAESAQALVLKGTFRADRHAERPVVDVPVGRPEPPKPLSEDAQAEWDRMLNRMEQCGTLSTVDDAILYQYCNLFAETEEIAGERTDAKGSVRILEEKIRDLKGPDLVAVFQEIGKLRHDIKGYGTSLRQNRMAMRQYLVELGQTPTARSRVKPTAAKSHVDPKKDKYFGTR